MRFHVKFTVCTMCIFGQNPNFFCPPTFALFFASNWLGMALEITKKEKSAVYSCNQLIFAYLTAYMPFPDHMTPSVIPYWNPLTKCSHILKIKVKSAVISCNQLIFAYLAA